MNKSDNVGIDKTIKNIVKHFTSQSWYAFTSAILVGFWTHMFILTNELFNHDDIGTLYFQSNSISDTRWLQSLFNKFVSPIGSGVMAGSLTILILAFSALLLVDLLKVNSKAFSAIIGASMTATPIVASFLSYVNGSYLFVVGIPFAILAVRLYEKGIKGYILAALSVMCAIAGYQSNLAVTIAVMYLVFFARLFEKDLNIKKWWISFGKAFSILLVGLILYFASNHIVIAINGTGELSGENGFSIGITTDNLEVSGYKAQAESGNLYIKEIPRTFVVAIKYFIKYNFNIFFGGANISFASKVNTYANIILFIASLIIVSWSVIKNNNIIKSIMLAGVTLMAPICINATEIILNGKCDETLQMMYSMVMVVPFVIVIIDKECVLKEKVKNIISNLLFVALIFVLYSNVQIINDAYLRMNSIYESAYGEMCRIVDRVEQLPEWQEGKRKLYFDYPEGMGYLINENYQAFRQVDDYIDMGWMGVFGTQVYPFWSNTNTSNFVKCYFGLDFETPTYEEIEMSKKSEKYMQLQKFPLKDSIGVIDGIIFVRMDKEQ